jgi:hypothetical protein
MSVNTISAGRYRLPPLAIVIAIVAAFVLAALVVTAVADATKTGFSQEVPAPAAEVPTPHWVQRYMEYEAPADVPTPHWVQRYVDERPVGGADAPR